MSMIIDSLTALGIAELVGGVLAGLLYAGGVFVMLYRDLHPPKQDQPNRYTIYPTFRQSMRGWF